jgi:hypothetical protein
MGGTNNTIDSFRSSILGGSCNFIDGNNSFIAGGARNTVLGNVSGVFAIGSFITGKNNGSTILADGTNRPKTSNADHSLNINFCNGIYLKGSEASFITNITGTIV